LLCSDVISDDCYSTAIQPYTTGTKQNCQQSVNAKILDSEVIIQFSAVSPGVV